MITVYQLSCYWHTVLEIIRNNINYHLIQCFRYTGLIINSFCSSNQLWVCIVKTMHTVYILYCNHLENIVICIEKLKIINAAAFNYRLSLAKFDWLVLILYHIITEIDHHLQPRLLWFYRVLTATLLPLILLTSNLYCTGGNRQ
jgi:hypothetical protein